MSAGDGRGPATGSGAAISRRRLVFALFALVAVTVVVWTVVAAFVAAHRLNEVRADVDRLTKQSGLDRATLARELEVDLHKAQSAGALLRQPGPRLFGRIPILGRNVDVERVVCDASAAAVRAGLTLVRATDGLDDGSGGVDVSRIVGAADSLDQAAGTLRAPLRRLVDQSDGWTFPQTKAGMRRARNQLLGLADRLARGSAGLRALDGVLGGDGSRRVLVGLMNNAELRGAGGLLSAFALGRTTNGRLALGPFRDVNLVAQQPREATKVAAPPEYQEAYGPYLANSTLWKNVTMSAQGADSAQVLSAVAAASVHVRPDVVVLFDVPAAADIISATGRVIINGERVTGKALTKKLLVDAYGNGSLSNSFQVKRRQALTSAASQAFDRLRYNATATPDLLQALLDAVAGRHIVIWSNRPAEERLLIAARAAGSVDASGEDVVLPITNNLGDSRSRGNKLDYYVDRHVHVTVRLRPDEADVTQTLTLRNNAPEDLGPYVEGLAHPGAVTELLSMDAAADANLTSFTRDGVQQKVDITRADGAQRLTTVVQLMRGSATTYRLNYQLPLSGGVYRLLLVPQALARPATLSVDIRAVDAELGVSRGIDQPIGDRILVTEPWVATRDIAVPVHSYRGLRGVVHHIAHFWTHKVTF